MDKCEDKDVFLWFLLNCETEDDDVPVTKEKSFLCSFNQPHLNNAFFFFCRPEVIFAMYCLFSMNFNFLEKKQTKKTNCPQIAKLKNVVSTYSVAWFQGWMFQLQWKVYNTVLFHPDPFRKKGSSLFSTVSYWLVWITAQQHLHWNLKYLKYLKWIKKKMSFYSMQLAYYKWMNICCLAWSPLSPPSPLQATRQQHSAGRSKLNTRPRGGRCCPPTFRCSSLMPSPLRCHTETKQVVRYARRGRRVWEGKESNLRRWERTPSVLSDCAERERERERWGGEGRRRGCSRVRSVAGLRMDGVNGQQGVWRGEQEGTQWRGCISTTSQADYSAAAFHSFFISIFFSSIAALLFPHALSSPLTFPLLPLSRSLL